MGRGEQSIERLHAQIEQWRKTREQRSPMSEELWKRAVKLAKRHGAYRVSKACNLNYGNLKHRLETSVLKRDESVTEGDFSFVELEGFNLEGIKPASAAVTVQVIDERGASLKVDYWNQEGFDMVQTLRYFWSRGQ